MSSVPLLARKPQWDSGRTVSVQAEARSAQNHEKKLFSLHSEVPRCRPAVQARGQAQAGLRVQRASRQETLMARQKTCVGLQTQGLHGGTEHLVFEGGGMRIGLMRTRCPTSIMPFITEKRHALQLHRANPATTNIRNNSGRRKRDFKKNSDSWRTSGGQTKPIWYSNTLTTGI